VSYKLNHTYELGANQGASVKASHKYLIVHETGNDNNRGNGSGKGIKSNKEMSL